jgi:hypothetical protein
MVSQWSVRLNGKDVGPITSQQLKALVGARRLNAADLVRREGVQTWAQAGKIKGLFPKQPSNPPPVPPLPEPVLVPIEPKQERDAVPAGFNWKPVFVATCLLFMVFSALKGAFRAKSPKPITVEGTPLIENSVEKDDEVRRQGMTASPSQQP